MKIKNLVVLIFVGILLVNLASAHFIAHSNKYSSELNTNDNVIFIIKSPESYAPNEDWNGERYSVYDYRNGYTYRNTQEYSQVIKNRDYSYVYSKPARYSIDSPRNYYIYNEPMRSYEEHQCYNSAPSDKLFYIKCK